MLILSYAIHIYAIHMGLVSTSSTIQTRSPDFASSRPIHETIGANTTQVPEEFRYLSQCFHQDMFMFASTEEEVIDNALRCLQPHQKKVIKRFLTELLERHPDIQELEEIWESTAPNWDFGGDGLRRFLTMIRDRIE